MGLKEVHRVKKPILYINIGIEFGLAIAIGIFMGYFLDKKLGTKPYLTFLFFIFGIIAAFKNLFSSLKVLERQGDNGKED